jgi:hemoglobin
MSLLPKARPKPATPFDRIGGRGPVEAMVTRFYDLMDTDPAYAALRSIHKGDLDAMRARLSDFLVAWMGGPRDWFDKNPGACIMSAHGAMPGIGQTTAGQWITCMTEAAQDIAARDPELAAQMLGSMASMCRTMARRAEEKATG